MMIGALKKINWNAYKFCYLGDLIGAGDRAEEASTASLEYVVHGNVRGTGPMEGSFSQSERKSIQGLYSECFGSETCAMKADKAQLENGGCVVFT